MLIEVDFGQLPFDTFATDQPWDHFALSRYNDWKSLGPRDQLGHLSTFIMNPFGPGQCFHIVSGGSGQIEPRLTLAIEPRPVFVTWPISEKVKILDLLNFAWGRPWWFWLIEKLFLLLPVDVWKGLMLIKVHLGQLPFDTFATGQPTGHSALTRYNDREKSGQPFPLGRLSS